MTRGSNQMMNGKRGGEDGVALLLALLFVVLLTAIVVEYAYENQVEASFVENAVNDFEAEVAAKSAVASGLALLSADLSLEQMGLNGMGQAIPSMGLGGSTGSNGNAQQQQPQLDSLSDAWAMGIPYRPINKAAMQCLIVDEYGKLNVNALVRSESTTAPNSGSGGQTPSPQPNPDPNQTPSTLQNQTGVQQVDADESYIEVFRMLFQFRGLEDDPTDAIMDWIDADDDTRPNGAESDYYQGLQVPYSCKNAPMDSIEELLLIKGITPEVFFGDPSQGQLPLTELMTVHGQPDGKININTAAWEVLDALGEAMQSQAGLADRVLEEREESPIVSDEDAQQRGFIVENQQNGQQPPPNPPPNPNPQAGQPPTPQQTPFIQQPFVYSSSVFRIRGSGEAGTAAVMIEAYVWRTDSETYAQAMEQNGNLDTGMNLSTNRRKGTSAQRTVGGGRTSGLGVMGGSGGPESGPQVFRILDWRMLR